MRRTVFPCLAASSLLLALSTSPGATRPHYGETIVVEIEGPVSSLEAGYLGDDFAGARALNKLRSLVGDRLVGLDSGGQPVPALAVSWEHDAANVKWRFKLRPGVKWHDGSPVTPADVAAALEAVLANRSWSVVDDAIEIDTGSPSPELPMLLAAAPGGVVLRKPSGVAGAAPVGTGPFRVVEWQPARRVVLGANEDYWGGRPYLDGIQFEMGRSSRERLIDLELDKADLVELSPAEARRAQQDGRKVWTSAPVEVLALKFNLSRPETRDQRLREAIARSIDRAAIQKVLLQNYGEAAGGILPPWLSGFAFLFRTARDLDGARQLRQGLGLDPPPLKLGYDSSDALARQVAERVAVNARDAGIRLDVSPLPQGWRRAADSGADVSVLRGRIDGPTLEQAVRECSEGFGFPAEGMRSAAPEKVYAAERRFLDDFSTVPLVDVPELLGLGPRVKNWPARAWGDWRLEDVWLEAAKP
jgi:peptide/nickel transport system substrate-binding protein